MERRMSEPGKFVPFEIDQGELLNTLLASGHWLSQVHQACPFFFTNSGIFSLFGKTFQILGSVCEEPIARSQ